MRANAQNSDTTAATLAWISYELCKNLDIQAKLRKAIDVIEPKKSHLDVDDVANCAFLDGVINEALRLHPAVSLPLLASAASMLLMTSHRFHQVSNAKLPLKASPCPTAPTYLATSSSGCQSTAFNAIHATSSNHSSSSLSAGPTSSQKQSWTSARSCPLVLVCTIVWARSWR